MLRCVWGCAQGTWDAERTGIKSRGLLRDRPKRAGRLSDGFYASAASEPARKRLESYPTRGRRTPGLRREEVAFLADIGVKWYARLEAGDEIHPSAATLTGIANALRLTNAELEYVLELAGVRQPLATPAEIDLTIPEPIAALLNNLTESRLPSAIASSRLFGGTPWATLSTVTLGIGCRYSATGWFEASSTRNSSRSLVPPVRNSFSEPSECSASTLRPSGRVRSLGRSTRRWARAAVS